MTENQQVTGQGWLVGKTMSEEELAKALDVPVGTVKRLRYEGRIPYVKIGKGHPLYLAESIFEWLKSKEIRESVSEPEIQRSGLNDETPG